MIRSVIISIGLLIVTSTPRYFSVKFIMYRNINTFFGGITMITISTHNGSQVAREHNLRNPKVVSKEEHIRADGEYEVWHDESLHAAYDRIFGEALDRYNQKQKRADRRIKSYLAQVEQDSNRKAVYEMIIGVYGDDCDVQVKKNILKEFTDTWKERNPTLELVGAYYHYDEQGKDPHVHIDYVPVAHGYQRGLDTQNGLAKALGEMGFVGPSASITAQILWEKSQNGFLEALCEERGLYVEHPGKGDRHLDTQEYKALRSEVIRLQRQKNSLEQEVEIARETAKEELELVRSQMDKCEALATAESNIDLDQIETTQKDIKELKSDFETTTIKRGFGKVGESVILKALRIVQNFDNFITSLLTKNRAVERERDELKNENNQLRNENKELKSEKVKGEEQLNLTRSFFSVYGLHDIFEEFRERERQRREEAERASIKVWKPKEDKPRNRIWDFDR